MKLNVAIPVPQITRRIVEVIHFVPIVLRRTLWPPQCHRSCGQTVEVIQLVQIAVFAGHCGHPSTADHGDFRRDDGEGFGDDDDSTT